MIRRWLVSIFLIGALALLAWPVRGPLGAGVASAAHAQDHGVKLGHSDANDVSPPLRDMKPDHQAQGHGGAMPLHLTRSNHQDQPDPVVQGTFKPQPPSPSNGTSGVSPHASARARSMAESRARSRLPSSTAPVQGLSIEGITNANSFCGCFPPDTNAAVGPNDVVETVNLAYGVYNKTTGLLRLTNSIASIFNGFGNGCNDSFNLSDPVILYDHMTGHWVLTIITTGYSLGFCIAASQTSDPTGAWYRYHYSTGSDLADYDKTGLWPDGIYMTFNMFGAGYAQPFVLDKAAVESGAPASFQTPGVQNGYTSLLPADLDGKTLPPAGTPEVLASLDPNSNGVDIWHYHVDWAVPANSTFGLTAVVPVAPFTELGTLDSVTEPAGDPLEGLGDRLLHRLAYRNLGSYDVVVANHSVQANGGGGVRWYEIRNPTSNAPTLYQQSTYAPDSQFRWMGSVAMDGSGDLAAGYSLSSSAKFPSIDFTGRLPTDPLNTLPQGEQEIRTGTGVQEGGSDRWGDYSSMSVDPTDDCTMWYTNEYYITTGFTWNTAMGSFKFPNCGMPPPTCTILGVVNGTLSVQVQAAAGLEGPPNGIQYVATNANVTVGAYSTGTKDPVLIQAAKQQAGVTSSIVITITDVNGNQKKCDPVMTSAVRSAGKPESMSVSGIGKADHLVHVANDTPGVGELTVTVNGQDFKLHGMKDGQTASLDIAGALKDGTNSVTVTTTGKPGGSAALLFGDM